jgi:hypothetical protein
MSMYLPNPAVRRAESDPVEFIELPPMAHEGDGETSMSVDASEIRGATQPQARVDLTRRAGNYVTELVPKSSGDSEDVRSIIHDLHYHITRHGPPQSLLKQLVAPVETRMLLWTNLPLADVLDGRARWRSVTTAPSWRPSMAVRLGCWCRISTSGRAPVSPRPAATGRGRARPLGGVGYHNYADPWREQRYWGD